MDLGTFGAILGFALQIEKQAAVLYEGEAPPDKQALFQELARGSRKRLERLERARREGVTEMILESITGLDSADFELDLGEEIDPLRQAAALEERAGRFFERAAEKMPVRGVARLFQRLAQENAQRSARLEE